MELIIISVIRSNVLCGQIRGIRGKMADMPPANSRSRQGASERTRNKLTDDSPDVKAAGVSGGNMDYLLDVALTVTAVMAVLGFVGIAVMILLRDTVARILSRLGRLVGIRIPIPTRRTMSTELHLEEDEKIRRLLERYANN
jgi:hypothetical protein